MKTQGPLSIAPMMDCTDRHFRYFMRQITRETILYTEMVVAGTILHSYKRGDLKKYLAFDPIESPLILQLGGSCAKSLAEAARISEEFGYDGINLNVGCPSDRVQSGRFGVCLMATPKLVGECMDAISKASNLPLSVKTRIGVDDHDDYDFLRDFLRIVHQESGVKHYTLHARKAWLQGLSPAQNRDIPPLNYDRVYKIKEEFPEFFIEINGGIKQTEQIENQLNRVDAVMIGRAAYDDPWIFSRVDTDFFNAGQNPSEARSDALLAMQPYLDQLTAQGYKPHALVRHMMGLYKGQSRARLWRAFLSNEMKQKDSYENLFEDSLKVFS